MQPRQIGITLAAVVVAFAVAFGIGKATGGSGGGGGTAKASAEGTKPVELAAASDHHRRGRLGRAARAEVRAQEEEGPAKKPSLLDARRAPEHQRRGQHAGPGPDLGPGADARPRRPRRPRRPAPPAPTARSERRWRRRRRRRRWRRLRRGLGPHRAAAGSKPAVVAAAGASRPPARRPAQPPSSLRASVEAQLVLVAVLGRRALDVGDPLAERARVGDRLAARRAAPS